MSNLSPPLPAHLRLRDMARLSAVGIRTSSRGRACRPWALRSASPPSWLFWACRLRQQRA